MKKPWKNGSPSQISAFSRCERRWFFGTILGVEQPQNPYQAIGEEGHNRVQSYIVAGVDPGKDDLADVVRSGLLFLPPAGSVPSENVEKWIRVSKDLNLPVDVVGQVDFEEPSEHRITDFKFRGRKASCAKPAHMYDDPQALTYAYEYMIRRSPLGPIRFRHLNFIREGGPAVPVEISYTDQQNLAHRFDRVVRAPMWKMAEASKADKASDLPPNREACDDYGGCPFRGVCLASEVQQHTNPGVPMPSLADLFKIPAPAAAPAAPAPAAVVQPQPFVVPGAVFATPGSPNPPDAPAPTPPAPVSEVAPEPAKKMGRKEKSVTLADGREISGKANLVLERGLLHSAVRKDEAKWAAYKAASEVAEQPGTSLAVDVVAKDLALLDAINAGEQPAPCIPTTKRTPGVVAAANITIGAGQNGKDTLFEVAQVNLTNPVPALAIGARIDAADNVHFDAFIEPYCKSVAEAKGVNYFGEIEYGKGPALVAAALTGDLSLRGPLAVFPRCLSVDRRHPCADAVVPILRLAYRGMHAIIVESWG